MKYSVRHKTTYQYRQSSSLSYNEAWLKPRSLPYQEIEKAELVISPEPAILEERKDYFGNTVNYFNVQQRHEVFEVEAISLLDRKVPQYLKTPNKILSWDDFKSSLEDFKVEWISLKEFILASPLVPNLPELANYALLSFQKGRSLFEAVNDLNTRIYQDYEYKQGFTTIATPLQKVAEARKGVCQDFAHVAISCLRSIGLPARYVSGYIETLPPEGQPRLVGSAASHAWFATYIPDMGWVDFDPTNNQIVKDQHISLGWGRDYADVPPLKGVIYNSGAHDLSVSVDVLRVNDGE